MTEWNGMDWTNWIRLPYDRVRIMAEWECGSVIEFLLGEDCFDGIGSDGEKYTNLMLADALWIKMTILPEPGGTSSVVVGDCCKDKQVGERLCDKCATGAEEGG